jgi:hypothetical protein
VCAYSDEERHKVTLGELAGLLDDEPDAVPIPDHYGVTQDVSSDQCSSDNVKEEGPGTPVVGVLVVDGLHGLELGVFDDAERVLSEG